MSAMMERAALHEYGRDGAAALIQLCFDHRAVGRALRIGLEIEHFDEG